MPSRFAHAVVSHYQHAPAIKVRRESGGAIIQFDTARTIDIYMDMETLRDLCNDIAEVLDGWFDERDRAGK